MCVWGEGGVRVWRVGGGSDGVCVWGGGRFSLARARVSACNSLYGHDFVLYKYIDYYYDDYHDDNFDVYSVIFQNLTSEATAH